MIGGRVFDRDAASVAARFAAFSISNPPEACTVIIQTPSFVAELTAPFVHETPHERRALGREQGAADLDAADVPFEAHSELGCVDGVVHVERD
jgi:hypothetical protein